MEATVSVLVTGVGQRDFPTCIPWVSPSPVACNCPVDLQELRMAAYTLGPRQGRRDQSVLSRRRWWRNAAQARLPP